MGLILGKSKTLKPNNIKEIRAKVSTQTKAIELTKQIAKAFGEQSKSSKPKKIKFLFR